VTEVGEKSLRLCHKNVQCMYVLRVLVLVTSAPLVAGAPPALDAVGGKG
jgi:hypothetical protein